MKKVILAASFASILLAAIRVESALIIGWADEYHAGNMECYKSSSSTLACGSVHMFSPQVWSLVFGSSATTSPNFSFLGQQGANTQGRANTRGKVFFRWNVTNPSSGAYTMTTYYGRWRRASVPAVGTSCSASGSETNLGNVALTFDSYAGGANGTVHNNRMLPYWDFASEVGYVGDVAYREHVYGYGGAGDYIPGTFGCFKIRWF